MKTTHKTPTSQGVIASQQSVGLKYLIEKGIPDFKKALRK